MTQLRVNHSKVRPGTYKAMLAMEEYTSGLFTDKVLYELLKIRVSQINGCAFCLDMHAKDLMKLGDYADHILLLPVWREVPLFTEKERAMLELAEAVARISEQGVPAELYNRVREHFDEGEYVDLIAAVNTISSWNRLAIATGMYPGCFTS
ncbi:carboxymuconolactone decarboxylase family protein [Paenibacillus enshidis]|uniref:Carboxymuconolactone decarboxylase family protein n=1 Tax=Paenibacillus enshidis TaxID=1458439 RepID=A0ABV5AX49_9BACL